MKIVRFLGRLCGNFDYAIYELEDGRYVCLTLKNGWTYNGWVCDKYGYSIGGNVCFRGIYSTNADGDCDLIGFEEV